MLDAFMRGSRKLAASRRLRSWSDDRRGVAAVEFALIAPLLFLLYFVTMEISQAIDTNKKVGRVASMVGDLVTQQQSVAPSTIDAIMMIGESILQPYNRSRPVIEVTAIHMTEDSTPQAEVVWSRRFQNGSGSQAVTPGSTTTVPENLRKPDTFYIRVSGRLDYRPVITWTAEQKASLGIMAAFDQISMNEVYYLRPRMSPTITCNTC
jgi:Flp pilus assembly protein TadG